MFFGYLQKILVTYPRYALVVWVGLIEWSDEEPCADLLNSPFSSGYISRTSLEREPWFS